LPLIFRPFLRKGHQTVAFFKMKSGLACPPSPEPTFDLEGVSMEDIRARMVICATKFSPACDAAFEAAVAIAKLAGAQLLVMHVLDSNENRGEIRQRLELLIQQRASGVPTNWVVARGEPGHVIARTARHDHADLIVVGEGRSSEALVPSGVPDVLERIAPCPVISVAPGESPLQVIDRMKGVPLHEHQCLVCARPMPDLICEPCRNRITAEAIDRRARLEKMAEHGMS
jgi:nucleotide-binding universal stress UspA family protein